MAATDREHSRFEEFFKVLLYIFKYVIKYINNILFIYFIAHQPFRYERLNPGEGVF